jgi:hypothetical protein
VHKKEILMYLTIWKNEIPFIVLVPATLCQKADKVTSVGGSRASHPLMLFLIFTASNSKEMCACLSASQVNNGCDHSFKR